ncbi:unnamed protein product, partial [Amoebophrya sp. A120]
KPSATLLSRSPHRFHLGARKRLTLLPRLMASSRGATTPGIMMVDPTAISQMCVLRARIKWRIFHLLSLYFPPP